VDIANQKWLKGVLHLFVNSLLLFITFFLKKRSELTTYSGCLTKGLNFSNCSFGSWISPHAFDISLLPVIVVEDLTTFSCDAEKCRCVYGLKGLYFFKVVNK
jgi:hypothetical protein